MTTMSPAEYDLAVRQYIAHFPSSVISGQRTRAHTVAVGGFVGDPHCGGFGTDVVYDTVPSIEDAQAYGRTIGLLVLREGHHNGDHLQPLDWVNDSKS